MQLGKENVSKRKKNINYQPNQSTLQYNITIHSIPLNDISM